MNDHIRYLVIKFGRNTPMGVFDKKKDAVSALKDKGYKYNDKHDMYYLGPWKDATMMATIDTIAYNKLGQKFR